MNSSDSFFTKTQEPYIVLLDKKEWKMKRERILLRDGFRCRHCGVGEDLAELNVHHKFYIEGHDPWEYNDSDLVTLCERCHREFHKTQKVPFYMEENGILYQIQKEPCSRCNGAGYFPEYRHVQGGVCFKCLGQRYEESIEFVRRYEKDNGISIIDTCWGFKPLTDSALSKLLGEEVKIAWVEIQNSNLGRLSVDIVLHTGRILHSYLDYAYDAKPGDRLDKFSLMYRIGRRQDGSEYLIVQDRFRPLNDESLSRIVNRSTGKDTTFHISGAHIGGDPEFGPEILRAWIETTSEDTVCLGLFMANPVLGMKLDPISLKYRVERYKFAGQIREEYLVKGRPL